MLSGEVMSVLIYGIDNEAKGFPTLIFDGITSDELFAEILC